MVIVTAAILVFCYLQNSSAKLCGISLLPKKHTVYIYVSWALFGLGTGAHVPPMFLGVGDKRHFVPPKFHRTIFFYLVPRCLPFICSDPLNLASQASELRTSLVFPHRPHDFTAKCPNNLAFMSLAHFPLSQGNSLRTQEQHGS